MTGMVLLRQLLDDLVGSSKISKREGAFLKAYLKTAFTDDDFPLFAHDIGQLHASIHSMNLTNLDGLMHDEDLRGKYKDKFPEMLTIGVVVSELSTRELIVVYNVYKALCKKTILRTQN